MLVFGIEKEFHTHVLERLRNLHATLEGLALPDSLIVGNGCLDGLGGRNVESGIIRIAREFNVAAVLDGKGLQRDDGQ